MEPPASIFMKVVTKRKDVMSYGVMVSLSLVACIIALIIVWSFLRATRETETTEYESIQLVQDDDLLTTAREEQENQYDMQLLMEHELFWYNEERGRILDILKENSIKVD